MTEMECAVREAGEALKWCERSRTGIVIGKIADEHGVDRSELARELSSRRRPTRKEKVEYVKKTVWLDMGKVKALGCGGDLGKLARYCDLGHDTLRIVDGRDGRNVRMDTVKKIADRFGLDPKDLLHEENRQIELDEKPEAEDYLTREERSILILFSSLSEKTEEELERYIVKRWCQSVGEFTLTDLFKKAGERNE